MVEHKNLGIAQGFRRLANQKIGSSACGRVGIGVWMPHSTLSHPRQRPERGSSPGITLLVQGEQPMDG